jgi:hypothetical protein
MQAQDMLAFTKHRGAAREGACAATRVALNSLIAVALQQMMQELTQRASPIDTDDKL